MATRPMDSILIVEDNKPLRTLLSFLLTNAGFETLEAADAMSAIEAASRHSPSLAILDRQLPDMDGMKLLRYWKAEETTITMPVIICSASTEESDRVDGLKAGADDYICKPFGREELVARVEALLRRTRMARAAAADPSVRKFAGLELDVRSLRVMADDQPLHLGPIEFKLLNLFMTHPDRALTRPQIVDKVWRINAYVDERTVDVHVRRLRRALQTTGHDRLIQTVRGVGYRFTAPPREPAIA